MMFPLSSLFKTASSNRYKFKARLAGHHDSITGVAFSNSGSLLASAGSDGIKLWDVEECTCIGTPPQAHRGAATRVAWAIGPDVAYETVCFGTQLGYLVVWRQVDPKNPFREIFSNRVGTGQEITSIAVEAAPVSTRIAIGTRDRVILVWKVDDKNNAESMFSVQLATTVPASVAFSSNMTKDIMVFGLYNGEIWTLHGLDGKVLKNDKTLSDVIGFASVNEKQTQFVVDNAVDGFDLYQLGSSTSVVFVRNFPTGTPIQRFPKQVLFGENSKVIVGGSDHGKVYVFDRKSGSLLDTLHHAKRGLVQTIATHQKGNRSTIASASSVIGGRNFIRLWTYESNKERKNNTTLSSLNRITVLRGVLEVVMAVATILFFIQSMEIKIPSSRLWRMNGTSQLEVFSGPVVKEMTGVKARLSQPPLSGTESVRVKGSTGGRNAGAGRIVAKRGQGMAMMAETVVPPRTKSRTPRVIRL